MNSPLCVDASVVVRLLVAAPGSERVHRCWVQWEEQDRVLMAPSLILYEITNALYRYERAGHLTRDEARHALGAALDLRIRLVEDAALHQEAAVLAWDLDLPSTYDAHYLAAARRSGAELWTADRRLADRVGTRLGFVRLATA